MTFKEWIFSDLSVNPAVDGAWGPAHIITLVLCILITIGLSFLRNKDYKIRLWVIRGLVFGLLFFELTRRGIYIAKGILSSTGVYFRLYHIMWNLLPRPWCAMSVWCMILSIVINKKFFYNFTAISAILNAIIFFAYPAAGFCNKYFQFENIYSIVTHSLLLITSISMITLKFTDFKYYDGSLKKSALRELICFLVILGYTFLQIYVLKISHDPMYFRPGNDVQNTLGMSYPLFLFIYIVFLTVFYNAFYIIQGLKTHTLFFNFKKPLRMYSRRLTRYPRNTK